MTTQSIVAEMDEERFIIENKLTQIADKLTCEEASQSDFILLTDYKQFTRTEEGLVIWTEALNKALSEHLYIQIPASDDPYWIDGSIILDSGRRIRADGAVIKQKPESIVCMVRNRNVVYGGDDMSDTIGLLQPDENISIKGGTWIGEGGSRSDGCLYDRNNSMPGVCAAFLFSNIRNLYLSDMTVCETGGFAFQVSNTREFLIDSITFRHALADGIHVTGLTYDGIIQNIRGDTGDDLVALNMWDWSNSSINFGDIDSVLVKNIESTGGHRALRILPGRKFYSDGTDRSCRADHIIVQNIKGIKEFKLYMQPYPWKDKPMQTEVGYGDYIWLDGVDGVSSIEVCSNIKHLSIENITVDLNALHSDSLNSASSVIYNNHMALVRVGPKSVTGNMSQPPEFWEEVYLPDACARINYLRLRNICDRDGKPVSENNLVFAFQMHQNSNYPLSTPRGGNGYGLVDKIIYE
jgi:hypothetical protein